MFKSYSQSQVCKFFAHNLWAFRTMKKISQTELAKRTGISRSSIANLEAGHTGASLFTAHTLAKGLDVTLEALVSPPLA